jgi:hypothetical protein
MALKGYSSQNDEHALDCRVSARSAFTACLESPARCQNAFRDNRLYLMPGLQRHGGRQRHTVFKEHCVQ